jgi:hypothetical protein
MAGDQFVLSIALIPGSVSSVTRSCRQLIGGRPCVRGPVERHVETRALTGFADSVDGAAMAIDVSFGQA